MKYKEKTNYYSIAGDMFLNGILVRELYEKIKDKIKNLISKL